MEGGGEQLGSECLPTFCICCSFPRMTSQMCKPRPYFIATQVSLDFTWPVQPAYACRGGLTHECSYHKPGVQNHGDHDGDVVPPQLGKPDPCVKAEDHGDQGQGPEGKHEAIEIRGAALACRCRCATATLIQGLPGGQDGPVVQHHLQQVNKPACGGGSGARVEGFADVGS